ncbi:MAG TPA: G1 family glutamic endopeptidase [Gaiellaceae bacterium]|nr:G1 family glutamic endopeptidase [Gaiellaceae bacterium]
MHRTLVSVALAGIAAALAAGAARASTIPAQVSSNWSGYAVIAADETVPVSFTDVTGTWVQPKATCTAGRASSSAFWVGLGGYDEDSNSLEQLGTGVDCNGTSTTPSHYAWWELVPASSVKIPLKIFPGDTINAAVLVNGQKITFSLRDVTRRTRFSKVLTTGQPLDTGSAEWIAEAPSQCGSFGRCRTVPLTNFGTVTFTNAAVIANAQPGTLVGPTAAPPSSPWTATPIELITGGRNRGFFGHVDTESGTGAVPGDVTADGRGFSVSWAQNLTAP